MKRNCFLSFVVSSLISTGTFAAIQNTTPPQPGFQTSGSSDASGDGQQGMHELENDAMDAAKGELNRYKSNYPEWLQRTDFSIWMQDYLRPAWYIRTIQPLNHSKTDVFFTQDQVSYQQPQTTTNFGLGYRHLTHKKDWIVGVNSFYDREWHYQQDRIGFGGELIGRYATLRSNFYQALSNQTATTVTGLTTFYEKALDGYDISADVPFPFLPWVRMVYTRYYWWRANLSSEHGNTFEFDVNPTGSLEAALGVTGDNINRNAYFLNLSWHFGRPARVEFAGTTDSHTQHALVARDLSLHMLDYVKRQNRIVVGNTSGVKGGITIARGT